MKLLNIEELLGEEYQLINSVKDSYKIFHKVCEREEERTYYSLVNSINKGCKYCLRIEKEKHVIKACLGNEWKCLDFVQINYVNNFLLIHEKCGKLYLKTHWNIKDKFECVKCSLIGKYDQNIEFSKFSVNSILEKKKLKCVFIWEENKELWGTWRCEFGYEWDESFDNINKNSYKCPHCKNCSPIEKKIQKILKELDYNLKDYKVKYDLVLNHETGRFLKVDFYLKDKNTIIHCIKKYDIIQSTYNSIEDNQKRLNCRRKFCKFSNIKFIEIYYNCIESIVRETLINEIGYKNKIYEDYL